jgi:hypothetical protein
MGTIGCVGVGVAGGVEVGRAVGVKVGGGSVAVGRAVWVSATPVCTMATAVFCIFVVLVCVQAANVIARNTQYLRQK